jgi:glutamine amidotransferase
MIAVVRTGTANLASVLAGLHRAGAAPTLCVDPDEVRSADRVVLPGVGAFGAARRELAAHGLDAALIERIEAGRPTLAICLGLQLFARSSEESPGVVGLSVVEADVTRLRVARGLRVPHMGWNQVVPTPGARFLQRGYAYYANSYKLDTIPPGWEGARSEHGAPFVAAIEQGDVLACQFHPELSGAWGEALLRRWLAGGAAC